MANGRNRKTMHYNSGEQNTRKTVQVEHSAPIVLQLTPPRAQNIAPVTLRVDAPLARDLAEVLLRHSKASGFYITGPKQPRRGFRSILRRVLWWR